MAERRRLDQHRVCLCADGFRKRAFYQLFYGLGRGAGVGRGLGVGDGLAVAVGVGETVPVAVGVAVAVGVGVGVTVGVGTPDCAQYLPPVLNVPKP